jgi:hypothetical protein
MIFAGLNGIGGGRYQATCAKCGRLSTPIPALTIEDASRVLLKIGWTSTHTQGEVTIVRCRRCSKETRPGPKKAGP